MSKAAGAFLRLSVLTATAWAALLVAVPGFAVARDPARSAKAGRAPILHRQAPLAPEIHQRPIAPVPPVVHYQRPAAPVPHVVHYQRPVAPVIHHYRAAAPVIRRRVVPVIQHYRAAPVVRHYQPGAGSTRHYRPVAPATPHYRPVAPVIRHYRAVTPIHRARAATPAVRGHRFAVPIFVQQRRVTPIAHRYRAMPVAHRYRALPIARHYRAVPVVQLPRRGVARRAKLRRVALVAGTVIGVNKHFVVLRSSAGGEIPIRFINPRDADRHFAIGQVLTVPVRYYHGTYCYARRYQDREDADDYNDYNYYNFWPYTAGYLIIPGPDYEDLPATYYDYYGYNPYYNDGYSSYYNYDPYQSYYGQFSAYEPYGSYNAQQMIAGFIVARSGSNLIVLTPSFRPMIIDASAAMSYNDTNGPLLPGRWITAYGYSSGNTFVATALT
jgi:hypothetical protein